MVDRNFVVSHVKINFREDGAVRKAVGTIIYVREWVPVGYGASIECSIVSAGPPTAVLLGH